MHSVLRAALCGVCLSVMWCRRFLFLFFLFLVLVLLFCW
jgi:hypothetical protein